MGPASETVTQCEIGSPWNYLQGDLWYFGDKVMCIARVAIAVALLATWAACLRWVSQVEPRCG